jgi:glycerol-3-phosphate dehydrogenase (NAD(P)+)
MRTKISILGDGAWGTALAILLARRDDHEVVLWSARPENARILRETRENRRLLPGVPIPDAITLTEDTALAIEGASLLVAAIPTVYLRSTIERFRGLVHPGASVLSLAKGIENATFRRPTEILHEVLGVTHLAVLSGPSHAEEVSRGLPTSVVAASRDTELALAVQEHFNAASFRVYTSPDLIGVELGGALKNIVGIAAGIGDGIGLGDNSKAALMTRALAEMIRFGLVLGAEPRTFAGLAGLGDLITTCMSRHGRNRAVGERLGRGEKLRDILASMSMVAEGVATTRSVHERAGQLDVEMPITAQVYRVLYEDKDPRSAVSDLMLREPRGEQPW